MPELKRYAVFISHAWDYSPEYYRFVNLLNNAQNFLWANYSVPEDDPLHNEKSKKAILEGLKRHMKPVNVVCILSGMYTSHSDWMQQEIDMAVEIGKPRIGVMPYGSQRIPQAVQDAADEIVGWSTGSIVSAIRKLAI